MTPDGIEAGQAHLRRQMDENLKSGGSEEQFEALLTQDEQLTATRTAVRGLAKTAEAKHLVAERAVMDPQVGPQESARQPIPHRSGGFRGTLPSVRIRSYGPATRPTLVVSPS